MPNNTHTHVIVTQPSSIELLWHFYNLLLVRDIFYRIRFPLKKQPNYIRFSVFQKLSSFRVEDKIQRNLSYQKIFPHICVSSREKAEVREERLTQQRRSRRLNLGQHDYLMFRSLRQEI